MLEAVYEECLCFELKSAGLQFRRQVELPVAYKGIQVGPGYRLDVVVGGAVIVEIKAVERLFPVHQAQLLTYMKLSGIERGLLMNFDVAMLKDGIRRMTLSRETQT